MAKTYRLMGKRGRTTIPFEIRMRMRLGTDSLISYEMKDENTVIVRREKVCDGCKTPDTQEGSILDVINSLSDNEQKHLLRYLTYKLTESEKV